MKRFYFFFFLLLVLGQLLYSQDYEMTFLAYGESTDLDSVLVENIEQNTSLTIPGDAILHLVGTITNVLIPNQSEISFQLYPNPMTESAILEFYIEEDIPAKISVFDIAGRLVAEVETDLSKGRTDFEISGLKSGIYNVRMLAGTWVSSAQLVSVGAEGQTPEIVIKSQNSETDEVYEKKMSFESYYQMQYNDGELLIFTGYSEGNSAISTLIPTQSQELLQNIVSCVDPDGYSYSTVTIENQVWMAENLRYLPFVNHHSENSAGNPHQYVYDYNGTNVLEAKNTENYENFGVLYNWGSAISSCPEGWHLPSNSDWTELERTICTSATCEEDFPFETNIGVGECGTNEGSMLAGDEELWIDFIDYDLVESSVFSTSGFMAVGGGFSYIVNEGFNGLNIHGFYWTSDIKGSTGLARTIRVYQTNISRHFGSMSNGYSVRCVRNVSDDVYLPVVCTQAITSLTSNSAISGGVVMDNGNDEISEQGIVWSTTANPTIEENIGISNEGNDVGEFVSELTGLDELTTYYVRAFAINTSGVGYGENISFETFSALSNGMGEPCEGIETVLYEDYVYNTIELGGRCWFAENLKYLPFVNELDDLSDDSPKYYVYGYDGTNVYEAQSTEEYQTYGVLYNWSATENACPDGWGVPTIKDWRLLTKEVCLSGDCESDFPIDGGINDSYGTYEGSRLAGGYDYWLHHNLTENTEFGMSGFDFLPYGWVGEAEGAPTGSHNMGFEAFAWCIDDTVSVEIWRYIFNIDFQRTLPYWDACWTNCGLQVRCVKIQVPSIVTDSVYQIDQNYAFANSTVLNPNGADVTARGIVWSFNPAPDIASNYIDFTIDGVGEGPFVSNITALDPATTYYVRAYATNSVGTAYGNEIEFNTPTIDIPILVTDSVTNITYISADCGGTLISTGGLEVLSVGIVYSTDENPTVESNTGIVYSELDENHFNAHLSELDYETAYYVRAFAVNSQGTSYGNELSFQTDVFFPFINCGDSLFYGDYYYKTVQIGEQCWFAENLRYDNGCTEVEYVDNTDVGYCSYIGDNEEEYGYLGLLYQWSVADSLCPYGWHLPTDEEWDVLTDYLIFDDQHGCLGNTYQTGKSLADTTGWDYYNYSCTVGNDPSTNNSSGFSILPTSYYYLNGLDGRYAYYWTATTASNFNTYERAYKKELSYSSYFLSGDVSYRYRTMSVRCLKTEVPEITTKSVNTISETTAKSGGDITWDGGEGVTLRGCVWSTSPNPTLEDNIGFTEDGDSIGEYISELTYLLPETQYFVRAYAVNPGGTAYGEEFEFTTRPLNGPCPGMETIEYEGYTYNTVQIGYQCWLAENLKYLPEIDNTDSISNNLPYYYVYEYNGLDLSEALASANYDTYGVLYNWTAAQTACPPGWELPTHYDWIILERYLCTGTTCEEDFPYYDQTDNWGMRGYNEGSKLAGGDLWTQADLTDYYDYGISNFNALPGSSLTNVSFPVQYGGETGAWWTSTDITSIYAKFRSLDFLYPGINGDGSIKSNAYSVRCFKINNIDGVLPTVISEGVSDITQISATAMCNISNAGTGAVTSRGIVWGTSPDLSYDVYENMELSGDGIGEYSISLTMLSPESTYYFRAFAMSTEGLTYGEILSFETLPLSVPQACEGTPFVDYEGYSYKTVKIGNQCWFAENLRYLPEVVDNSTISTTEPYCYVFQYEGTDTAEAKLVDNYIKYGVLYNWSAIMNGENSSANNPSNVQGICPIGWHVPSKLEYNELLDYLSDNGYDFYGVVGDNNIGKSLADTCYWHTTNDIGEIGNNLLTNNSSGFSARPSGTVHSGYSSIPYTAHFWTTTQQGTDSYYRLYMAYSGTQAGVSSDNASAGNAVRCIRDYELPTVTTGEISEISTTTAYGSGTVVSEGELPVTARGFVWSTLPNPTIDNNDGVSVDGNGEGEYSGQIYWLLSGTTYYVRAYATCNAATVYGDVVVIETESFPNCGTVDYQGHTYKTVMVGERCWFAENLRYLPSVVPSNTGSTTTPYYYVYGYSGTSIEDAKLTENYNTYGVMYNWLAASMACPSGWSLPTHNDWTYLERELLEGEVEDTIFPYDNTTNFVPASNVGSQMADSAYLWTEGVLKENFMFGASGFSALPGGYRNSSGSFYGEGASATFWSVSEQNNSNYWYRIVNHNDSRSSRNYSYKSYGRYVRCVQPATMPVIETIPVSNILDTSVNTGVSIISDGGAYISTYGIVWDTVSNPTIENYLDILEVTGPAYSENELQISGLYPDKTIYIKSFATNIAGTVYGDELNFVTPSPAPFVECGDNLFYIDHYYKTVQIGEQCWFAENLKYLPEVYSINSLSESEPRYYIYGYTGDNIFEAKHYLYYGNNMFDIYGVLYNWEAVMDGDVLEDEESIGVQGICPNGWVVPSENTWNSFVSTLVDNGFECENSGNENNIAKAIADSLYWSGSTSALCAPMNNSSTNNATGFSGRPAGTSNNGGYGSYGYWWTSDVINVDYSRRVYIYQSSSVLNFGSISKESGISVRCILDQ